MTGNIVSEFKRQLPAQSISGLGLLLAAVLGVAAYGDEVVRVCSLTDSDPECDIIGLSEGLRSVPDGSTVILAPGTYREALVVSANDLTIVAEDGAHIRGVAAEGKAALVLRGNRTVIDGLECSEIWVPDGNGACIRLEGGDLTLRNVYFHDSQEGILGGGGTISIEDSVFERLGGDEQGDMGTAHAIYALHGNALIIRRSLIISGKEEGHEIKSRMARTLIEDSVIASLDGLDSRLIDVPNGGELIVRNSVLQEGPNSSNYNIIGYGLEGLTHDQNSVVVEGNTIISDRRSSKLYQGPPLASFTNNKLVAVDQVEGNIWYRDRQEAGLLPYPALPPLPVPSRDKAQAKETAHPSVEIAITETPEIPRPVDPKPRAPATGDALSLSELVYQISPGTWFEVPNSSIRSVLPRWEEIVARCEADPECADPQHTWGVSGPDMVINAWCGAAFNGSKMYFHCGGHRDYGGNEIYELDVNELRWTRLTEPSLVPPASASTTCPRPGDGTPLATHTADGIVWSPATQTFFRFLGADYCWAGDFQPWETWEFDPAARVWQQHENWGGIWTDWQGKSIVDPETGRIVVVNQTRARLFDPIARRFVGSSPESDGGYIAGGTMAFAPDKGRALIAAQGGFFTVDVSKRSVGAPQRVHASGGLIPTGAGWGNAYDALRGVFVLWPGGRDIHLMDPDTAEVTHLPNQIGPAPTGGELVYSKWVYIEELDVFLGYNNPAEGVWLYRLPADD